jgi:hypothetical protein
VALEALGREVVDVDVRASRDVGRRETDDLAVLADRLTERDGPRAHLVAIWDLIDEGERTTGSRDRRSRRERLKRDADVVARVKDDEIGCGSQVSLQVKSGVVETILPDTPKRRRPSDAASIA